MNAKQQNDLAHAMAAVEFTVAGLFEEGVTDRMVIATALARYAQKNMAMVVGEAGAKEWFRQLGA